MPTPCHRYNMMSTADELHEMRLSHIFSVRRVYNIDITIYSCAGTPRGQ